MKTLLNNLLYILVGLLTGGLVWLVSMPPRGVPITLLPPPTPQPLQVYVSGAVRAPGVYALPQNARIHEAVDAAGGFLAEAATQSLNLAARATDGQHILVPVKEKTVTGAPSVSKNSSLININIASQQQLESLPGIGPETARKIIEYRDLNGFFTDTIGLIHVKGIGSATYEKIKHLITIGP